MVIWYLIVSHQSGHSPLHSPHCAVRAFSFTSFTSFTSFASLTTSKSFTIRTSETPLPQLLYNPHLQAPLGSAGNKGLITPLESALTRNSPVSRLQSALAKTWGWGRCFPRALLLPRSVRGASRSGLPPSSSWNSLARSLRPASRGRRDFPPGNRPACINRSGPSFFFQPSTFYRRSRPCRDCQLRSCARCLSARFRTQYNCFFTNKEGTRYGHRRTENSCHGVH